MISRALFLRGLPLVFACGAAFGQAPAYLEEVPFVTSPDNVTLEMLRIAEVGPRDHVIDLGSGDGRIVNSAAKHFGATGMGVEYVPELVRRSLQSARDAGVADRVSFREQDLFQTDLSPATVITMYLLPEVNLALRPKLLTLKPGTRIVSHDWNMGDWKPDKTTVVDVPDKKIGLEKTSKVHLWIIPARVDGLWCGRGLLGSFQLRLKQAFQQVEATLSRKRRDRLVEGVIQGNRILTQKSRQGSLELEARGEELRIVGGEGALRLTQGGVLARARGSSCG